MEIADIKNKRFEKAAFGYKVDDVDEFLSEITTKFKKIEQESADFELKVGILAEKIEEYRKDEDTLREVLVDAKKLSSNIKAEAKTKSEAMLADAKNKSDKMMADAKKDSEKILNDARKEAERIIGDAEKEHKERILKIKSQAAFEQENLTNMQKNVSDFKSQLLSIYKEHINLINKLPEIKEKAENDLKERHKNKNFEKEQLPVDQKDNSSKIPQKEINEAIEREEIAKTKSIEEKNGKKPSFLNSPLNKVTITEKEMKIGNYESKFGDLKFGTHATKK